MDNDEQRIKAAARDWLLRLSLGSSTDEDRVRCAAWCAADPRHAAAYRRFESIWQDAAALEELRSLATLPPVRSSRWLRVRTSVLRHPLRWTATTCLTIAITGVALWLVLAPVHYATGIAEVRTIHLSDGSVITLGARSSLEIAFRRHERRVALLSGVAFFSVAKDPSRPFVVLVGDKEVRDLGTQFEIRRGLTRMRVSVVEGMVEVTQVPGHLTKAVSEKPRVLRLAGNSIPLRTVSISNGVTTRQVQFGSVDSAQARILTAGQQVTTTFVGDIPDPHATPPGYSTAWRHGRFVYVDTPLKDIIADANRYSHEPIKIADDRVANLRISVTCPSGQIDKMVSALAHGLSLKVVRRKGGGIVLLDKKPGD